MYVIWSYEHNAWWAPNERGYTEDLERAGRYSAEDAGRIVTNSVMLEEIAIEVRYLERWHDSQPPRFHPYLGEMTR